MHFKRIKNIFKLKRAWAENDCLPWMLPCNPLGAWVISHRAVETETDIFFAKMRREEEEQEILSINSVNVLLPCTINRTAREGCRRVVAPSPWRTLQLCVPCLLAENPPDQLPFIPSLVAHLDWEHLRRIFLCRVGTLPWLQPTQPFPCSLLWRASHKQLSQAIQ